MTRTRFNSNHAFYLRQAWLRGADPIYAAVGTIFAKQNARNAQHEVPPHLIKAGKGVNYGIPDISWRRRDDGALRSNYRGLHKAA
jgi:hypothetical protein